MFINKHGVRESIVRKLPLGGLINHSSPPKGGGKKNELYSPIDALNSQQLVGKVMAYQGNDVEVQDESLNTLSGE